MAGGRLLTKLVIYVASDANSYYHLGSMSSEISSHISVCTRTARDPRNCIAAFMTGTDMKFRLTGESGIVMSAQRQC